MQIRIIIDENASVTIESVSILEDLHHDFLYFKGEAERLSGHPRATCEWILEKRYERAALLALMAYVEGAVNHWLEPLLSPVVWQTLERKSLDTKCDRLVRIVTGRRKSGLNVRTAKDLRNDIVHLKTGLDLRIYDDLSLDLLERTEKAVDVWLASMERVIGRPRHPNTKAESAKLSAELGHITAEAGSN